MPLARCGCGETQLWRAVLTVLLGLAAYGHIIFARVSFPCMRSRAGRLDGRQILTRR